MIGDARNEGTIMTNLILKSAAVIGAAAVLQGCAAFGGIFRASEASAPAAAPAEAAAETPQYRASAAPVGLVRCKSARVDMAAECWRRGDVHVMYPAASPGGVDPGSAAYASASPASVKKK